MEDPEGERDLTYRVRLTVSPGQSVTPIQGIVQREVVIAFVMGTHPRMGRASAVRLLDVDLLRLVCLFADIWREFTDGIVIRATAPGDKMSYCIVGAEPCDPRFASLIEPDLRHLTCARVGRKLDRWFLEIVNFGNAQPLTWTETEIV